MNANRQNMDRSSEPDDDIPDMSTPEWVERFKKAPLMNADEVGPLKQIETTIRLDADVLDHFKAGGKGWQTRINAALRKVMQDG